MHRLLVPALLLLAPATLADEIRVETAKKVLDFTDRENLPPVGPASKSVPLEAAASDEVLPGGSLPVARGVIELAGRGYALVLARTMDHSGMPDRIAVDRNGDGAVGEDEVRALEFQEMKDRDGNVRGHRAQVSGIELGGVPVNLMLAPRGEGWYAGLTALGFREGTFEAGGKTWRLALVDTDWDGREDGWTAVTGPVTRPAGSMSLTGIGHGFFADGSRIRLVRLDGDTAILQVTEAGAPDPADEAAQRERVEHAWAARFDEEREQFVEARGIDADRPRAVEPIRWRWVTYDEAKELAASEGKPLFVDVLAFWCVWCYRMDYYTYVDAEVAQLLNDRFIPVKIVQEQDRAGDYQRLMTELELRGIPAMGVWSPQGELIHKISGWKKPEDFLTELRTALGTSE